MKLILILLLTVAPTFADVATDLADAEAAHTAGDVPTRDAKLANIVATYQSEPVDTKGTYGAVVFMSDSVKNHADANGILDWLITQNGLRMSEYFYWRSFNKVHLGDLVGAKIDGMQSVATGPCELGTIRTMSRMGMVDDFDAALLVQRTYLVQSHPTVPFNGRFWRNIVYQFDTTGPWALACGASAEMILKALKQQQLEAEGREDKLQNSVTVQELSDGGGSPLTASLTLATDVGDVANRKFSDVVTPAISGDWDAAIVAAWAHLKESDDHEPWGYCIANLLRAKQQHINGAGRDFLRWQNNDPAVPVNPLITLGLIP
jgi:hypothetical protein